MGRRLAVIVVVGAVLVAAGVLLRSQRREADADRLLDRAMTETMTMRLAEQERPYVEGLLRSGHAAAWEAALTGGGAAAQDLVREQAYFETLYGWVLSRCAADGQDELAQRLTEHWTLQGVNLERAGGRP